MRKMKHFFNLRRLFSVLLAVILVLTMAPLVPGTVYGTEGGRQTASSQETEETARIQETEKKKETLQRQETEKKETVQTQEAEKKETAQTQETEKKKETVQTEETEKKKETVQEKEKKEKEIPGKDQESVTFKETEMPAQEAAKLKRLRAARRKRLEAARKEAAEEENKAPAHAKHLNYAADPSKAIPDDIGFRNGDKDGAHHDEDGWYDLSLDITGGEESWSDQPQADIIFVIDNSNSMKLAPYMHVDAVDENGNKLFTRINSQSEDPNEYSTDDNNKPQEHYVLKDGVLWPAFGSGETSFGGTTHYWCLVSDASQRYGWSGGKFVNLDTGKASELYEYKGSTRMEAAQKSIDDQLKLIQGSDIDTRISVVSFGSSAKIDLENSGDISKVQTTINSLEPTGGGTNWDDALQKAKSINTRDGIPAYVVFISDGNPTFWEADGNIYSNYRVGEPYDRYHDPTGNNGADGGNGQESDTVNVEESWQHAYRTADTFLAGKDNWNFYSVAAFNTQIFHMSANENGLAYHVYNGAVPDGHVYNAQQADDFTNAMGDIITDIKNHAKKISGHFSAAKIQDTLSSLIDVKEGSLTYTVSKLINGEKETLEFKPGSKTAVFSDGSVVNVPEGGADLKGSSLTWDLGSSFELDTGVTYSVHVKVRPNQEAHDISAADKVGESADNADLVTDGGKTVRNSDDDLMVYANSGTPQVSYKNPKGKDGSSDYVQKPELPVPYSKLKIKKEWKTPAPDNVTSVEVELLQDGKPYQKLTLNADNSWTASALVPAGPTGHSYQVRETTDLGEGWVCSCFYTGYDTSGQIKNKEISQISFDSPKSLEQREGAFTLKNAKLDLSGQVELKKVWKDADGNEIKDTAGLQAKFELWRRKTQKPAQEKKTYTVTVKTYYFYGTRTNSGRGTTDDSDKSYWDPVEGPEKTYQVQEGDTLPFTINVTGQNGQMGIYSSTIGEKELAGDMSDPTEGIFTINGSTGQKLYRKGSYQLEDISSDVTVDITLLGRVKQVSRGWPLPPAPSINDSVSINFGTPIPAPDPDPVPAGEEKVPDREPVILKDENWSYTWDKLPIADADGNAYIYFVKETECSPGFELEEIDNNGGITNGTITAANRLKSVSIPVSKVWDDNDNRKGIRPDSVRVCLYRNGEKTGKTADLKASAGWKAEFTDLPASVLVNENGRTSWQQAEYTVKEDKVPDGYISSAEKSPSGAWTVINKLIYRLPNTAGPGTYPFILCGSALIASALLLSRKSRGKGDEKPSE